MKKIFLIFAAMMAIMSSNAQMIDTVEVCDTVADVSPFNEGTVCDSVETFDMEPIDLTTAPISSVYTSSILQAEFPGEIETKTEEGVNLISCQEPGCDLRIAVCPLGLEPFAYETLALEFCNGLELASGHMIELNGYNVKAYNATMRMTEEVAFKGKLYVFSNGNTTIFLSAVSLNPEVDWWADHVTLNLPKENNLNRQERLSNFVDFFNIMEGDSGDLKLDAEDNGSDLVLKITNNHVTGHRSHKRVSRTLYKLINAFTLFREYADAGYLFTIKIQDSKGEAQTGYEFPYSEYSKWPYKSLIELDDSASDLDDYPAEEIGG